MTIFLAVPARAQAVLPPIEKVELTDSKMLVNGQPFLPIGIYMAAHNHNGLRESSERGFNLVQAYGATPELLKQDLDNIYHNGMYAFVALNGAYSLDMALLERTIALCRNHPGLLVWSLEDEPNIRTPEPANMEHVQRPFRLPPNKLQPAYELLKKLDPAHPVFVNLAHGILQDHVAYEPVADIMGADIYPVPEVALPSVASYADVVVEGAKGKPGWIVLQISPIRPHLGEKDRRPTLEEVRCMTYMSLARGITGVLYFGFVANETNWRATRDAPAYFAQLGDLNAELKALEPLLLSPRVEGKVGVEITRGEKGMGPWNHPALHTSLHRTTNGYFLVVANGLDTAVSAQLSLPGLADLNTEVAVRFESRLARIDNGIISDDFAPYAVHLYEIALRREASPQQ